MELPDEDVQLIAYGFKIKPCGFGTGAAPDLLVTVTQDTTFAELPAMHMSSYELRQMIRSLVHVAWLSSRQQAECVNIADLLREKKVSLSPEVDAALSEAAAEIRKEMGICYLPVDPDEPFSISTVTFPFQTYLTLRFHLPQNLTPKGVEYFFTLLRHTLELAGCELTMHR